MTSRRERQSAVIDEEEKLFARVEFVNGLSETEGYNDSPINVDIKNTTPIILPRLAWFNYELPPKKMKVTNTGHTVILSAKWFEERPFLAQGPTLSTYVFNQIHFHWGPTGVDGSEHKVENKNLPLEMHVVHFKSSYATQDIALREKDGMIVLIFFFQLQPTNNPALEEMIQGLPYVAAPHTSVQISPFALTNMMPTFAEDYLVYWGCVNAVTCKHRVMWFVCRETMGISSAQLDKFRMLLSTTGDPLPKHVRKINTSPRTVFHVNGGETSTSSTLLPPTYGPRHHISMPGPGYRRAAAAAAKAAAPPPSAVSATPGTFYAGDNATGQAVPVYAAMESGHFMMPYAREPPTVGAIRSVTFETKQGLNEEEGGKSDRQLDAQREGEQGGKRELEEAEGRRKAEEEEQRRQELEEAKGRRNAEEEEQRRKVEEEEQRKQETEKIRWHDKQRQEQQEKEAREAKVLLRREREQQLRQAKRDHAVKARHEQAVQEAQLQEPIEVFHAATQKPSIGFKLRRPLVHMTRKLDMATQAPSMSDVYRPANALSAATVFPCEEEWGDALSATVLGDDEGLNDARSATVLPDEEGLDNARSATVLPDNEGWGNSRSPTVYPASTVSRTSAVSFAPTVVAPAITPSVMPSIKSSVVPSIKSSVVPSIKSSVVPSTKSSVVPSAKPNSAPSEGTMARHDFSTLSCFDTKDYHMTPKGSLAPTASYRRNEEELEVYNTTFKEVGPLSSEWRTPSKK